MANLGLVLGLTETPVTLHEVLAGKAPIQDAIYEGPYGLKVVPSGLSLEGFQNADPARLRDVMCDLADRCDFLFFDAPAGIDTDAVIPLTVADEVLLVVNPEISSLVDALKIKILTEMVGGTVKGALLNRVTLESTDVSRKKIEKALGVPVIDTIPEDANVRRAAAARTPVVAKYPGSESSKAFRRVAATLAGFPVAEEPEKVRKGLSSGLPAHYSGENQNDRYQRTHDSSALGDHHLPAVHHVRHVRAHPAAPHGGRCADGQDGDHRQRTGTADTERRRV